MSPSPLTYDLWERVLTPPLYPPLQGKEPSVRQLALLHFRNTIVLSVKLDDALSRPRARVPPSVTQMLLILQVGGKPAPAWLFFTRVRGNGR